MEGITLELVRDVAAFMDIKQSEARRELILLLNYGLEGAELFEKRGMNNAIRALSIKGNNAFLSRNVLIRRIRVITKNAYNDIYIGSMKEHADLCRKLRIELRHEFSNSFIFKQLVTLLSEKK